MNICRRCGFGQIQCQSTRWTSNELHPFDPIPETIGEEVLSKCVHSQDNPCDALYAEIKRLNDICKRLEERHVKDLAKFERAVKTLEKFTDDGYCFDRLARDLARKCLEDILK